MSVAALTGNLAEAAAATLLGATVSLVGTVKAEAESDQGFEERAARGRANTGPRM